MSARIETADCLEPKIKAIAPWFGGKRTLAPRIVAELGPHSAYWEPFCGSMAVLFAKPKCRLETVNDLHGDLINLARVVRDSALSQQLYARARLVFCADDELKSCDLVIRNATAGDEPSVERALAYLVVCWQGRNGECGLSSSERAKTLCIRWSNNGGAPATRWHGAVRSIGAWHRRLCTVTITRRCGIEMLGKIADESDGAIYVDSPYLKKSDTYMHDFTWAQHVDMAAKLQRFKKARVVVSYYDDPRLSELYPGWTKAFLDVQKHSANQNKGGKKGTTKAPEVLLINGSSYTATRQLF